MSSGLPGWDSALLCRPWLLTLIQQLYLAKTGFLLCGMDENCIVGQGLACHFNTALCTLHGFNVVCAAGLVLRSCEIVLGHGRWECSASWEGKSFLKVVTPDSAASWRVAQLWPCFRAGVTELSGFGRFLQLQSPIPPCPGFPGPGSPKERSGSL